MEVCGMGRVKEKYGKQWILGEAATKSVLMRKMLTVAKICWGEKRGWKDARKGRREGGRETNQKVESREKLKGTGEKLDVEGRRTK